MQRIILTAICALLWGCSSLIPVGSGGGTVHYIPSDDPPSSFSLRYENWVGFRRSLTISVDSLFARLKAKDKDAQGAVRDFKQPASDLLSHKYGLFLYLPDPVPDARTRTFTVDDSNSPWEESRKDVDSPLLTLPQIKRGRHRYRWRAKAAHAQVTFNSLTPKRVFIRVDLKIQMQVYSPVKKRWGNLEFRRSAIEQMGDRLKKDLNKAYYRYLRDRYGIEITSSAFGGLNE